MDWQRLQYGLQAGLKRDITMPENRGGKRAGTGRKRLNPPAKARCVYLTDEQTKLLRMWGHGDVSAGLRWLIKAAAPLIHRVESTPPE